MSSIDALDARILLALDDAPDRSVLALARDLGVARNTVHARLARLRVSGALRPASQRVDPAALDHPLIAFVSLALSQSRTDRAIAALAELPQVLEVHATSGETDLLLKVVARDTGHLYSLTEAILAIDGVHRSSTAVVLHTPVAFRVAPLLEERRGGLG